MFAAGLAKKRCRFKRMKKNPKNAAERRQFKTMYKSGHFAGGSINSSAACKIPITK
jgi:hypothetical protein